MNAHDFYNNVEDHPELEGLLIGKDAVYLRHLPTGTTHRVLLDDIIEHKWEDICGVICGTRDATVLRSMTRVVGYYSRIDNWNKSKLGELWDRQKGNYALPEDKATTIRGEVM